MNPCTFIRLNSPSGTIYFNTTNINVVAERESQSGRIKSNIRMRGSDDNFFVLETVEDVMAAIIAANGDGPIGTNSQ
jgi:hypothetical protein